MKMVVAPTDHILHSEPATTGADENGAYAETSKVLWVPSYACTHGKEVWERWIVRSVKWREGPVAFDSVVRSSFDGRDSESSCGGGSTGVEDEENT